MDEDLAASLPRSPMPAPARRQAAIEEALRRFDGGPERPAGVDASRQAPAAEPWWRGGGRSWAPALAMAVLVLLIALPLAWAFLRDRPGEGGSDRGPTLIAKAPPAPAPGRALATNDPGGPAVPGAAIEPEAQSGAPRQAPARQAASGQDDEIQLAQLDMSGRAPPAPPPSAPPPSAPPPPEVRSDSKSASSDGRAEERFAAASPVVVTGSRIRTPEIQAEPEAENDDGTIVLTGTRSSRASRRGDWNACTVDDPSRSLAGCRHLVDPRARGAAGKSAASLSEGLSSAWQGEYREAIAAFDRAIAAAPGSAFAYLNRGLAWKREGDLDRALADLDRAVRYAPRTARLYYQRGQILRQRGDEKRARADERRAVNLDPDYQSLVP